MTRSLTIAAVAACAILAAGTAARADHHEKAGAGHHDKAGAAHGMVIVKDDDAVKYQSAFPTLPKGMKIAVLSGNPDKEGEMFALRVKVPANFVIPPHSHPTPETLTVVDGEIYHALGKTVDKKMGDKLDDGGFAFLPAGTTHYLWSTEETVLQVNGVAPFKVLWTNPADDPKNQK